MEEDESHIPNYAKARAVRPCFTGVELRSLAAQGSLLPSVQYDNKFASTTFHARLPYYAPDIAFITHRMLGIDLSILKKAP